MFLVALAQAAECQYDLVDIAVSSVDVDGNYELMSVERWISQDPQCSVDAYGRVNPGESCSGSEVMIYPALPVVPGWAGAAGNPVPIGKSEVLIGAADRHSQRNRNEIPTVSVSAPSLFCIPSSWDGGFIVVECGKPGWRGNKWVPFTLDIAGHAAVHAGCEGKSKQVVYKNPKHKNPRRCDGRSKKICPRPHLAEISKEPRK